jgi:Fuc2NAc and GlcNAc transferase
MVSHGAGDLSVAALVTLPALAVLAFAGTMVMRRYALARLLDIPNDRSMHTNPTPRGGGLAIAVVALGAFGIGSMAGWLPWRTGLAFLIGGAAVAAIGWIDDHRSVPARVRLAVHVAASAFAVSMLGGFRTVDLGVGPMEIGLAGSVLAVVGITWAINFFNFMDGIDGLAAIEAITVAVAGGLLLEAAGQPGLAWVAFVIAASVLGFLPWNWSPARIFMGDVGSGLLGFFFGALAVASENSRAVPASVWGLLLGVFVVDATITFGRRLVRGERVYEAHRKHAYQRLVQSGLSHRAVSLLVLATNLGLAGLAALVIVKPELAVIWLGTGLLVLGAAYLAVERIQSFDG